MELLLDKLEIKNTINRNEWDDVFNIYLKEIEILVENDSELKEKANKSYLSFLRFYASIKNKETFPFKKMHLGHVARSMGLKEKPTDVALGSKK